MTDVLTGLYLAIGVLASVHARRESQHGYAIDLALLDSLPLLQPKSIWRNPS